MEHLFHERKRTKTKKKTDEQRNESRRYCEILKTHGFDGKKREKNENCIATTTDRNVWEWLYENTERKTMCDGKYAKLYYIIQEDGYIRTITLISLLYYVNFVFPLHLHACLKTNKPRKCFIRNAVCFFFSFFHSFFYSSHGYLHTFSNGNKIILSARRTTAYTPKQEVNQK